MEKYKSQLGFVQIPIKRGFNEIGKMFEICCNVCHSTKGNAYILGGYVRYMCSPKENPIKAGDVDVYCENQDVFDLMKTTLFNLNLKVKNDNPMALTFETNPEFPKTIQIIKPIKDGAIVAMGGFETILSHFDFTVIRCGLINETVALVDADFLHDEERNLLRLKNIHCPISSTLRCMKYAKKGYFLQPSECLKLFADWQNRSDDYKFKIVSGLQRIEAEEQLSEKDINELERLMRID